MVSATPLTGVTPGIPTALVVHGRDYASVDKSDQAVVVERGCAVAVATRKPDANALTLEYTLPTGLIPDSAQISRLDTAVCGSVEGEDWEVYGPAGSDPFELEVQQPDSDGCWHFERGTGDSKLVFYISDDTTLRIERVVYTVTFS